MQQLTPSQSDDLKARAATFPEAAFDFVREGLGHTVGSLSPELAAGSSIQAGSGDLKRRTPAGPAKGSQSDSAAATQHVTGQQLCEGLRHLAYLKYGDLAGAVLGHWGVASTDDFGVMVYAMIDRGELRSGDQDRLSDFHNVYSFKKAFPLLIEPKPLRTPVAEHSGPRVDGIV